jgi:hypothetical protein
VKKTLLVSGLLLIYSALATADSSILKLQAQTLNMDASKLAVTSTMGVSSLVMTCDNLERFEMLKHIEDLDTSSYHPKGIFGKKKKIQQLKDLKASLTSTTSMLTGKCVNFYQDQQNTDKRLELTRDFRELMTLSQNFLSMVLGSK